MSWNDFHRRGAVLEDVIAYADEVRTGLLPVHLPGVTDNFRDELDLLSALMLKWHARFSGYVERGLVDDPLDLALAVAVAWRQTADELPGIRAIIDHYTAAPTSEFMADCLDRARQLEWRRMAAAAGMFNQDSAASLAVGRRIEAEARTLRTSAIVSVVADDRSRASGSSALVHRFRDPKAS